ncbi:MAG: acyl-CoA dehydrogenase, partial [Actinobacteria bacterium]|nr:acyl-CoA dehydrogenase [Actinomycetota bacterium]NIS35656.1 acyl-CoA dehydrogenase [Actinomycetota bacterium]NIT98245.1 acyl-CoA dehydrogenase [Actinomycetota bacterium]NIU21873.1 acyl-CoA dehydrogenase [Actinomycetota bacterium]NIU70308.1 acyl-CoA dehydrogenase [Actinomycetota bacterium]
MRAGGVIRDHLAGVAATVESMNGIDGLGSVATHLAAAAEATAAATDWLIEHGVADPRDALAGATAYLEMLAVTTGGQALADGAVAVHEEGDDEAGDRAVLARFFAANRLARVPGMLAAAT